MGRKWIVALALAGGGLPGVARAEWWEATTSHFVVIGEGPAADTKDFALKLERFDTALRVLQKMPTDHKVPDAGKVTVFRFGDVTNIGQLAGAKMVAGFYIPRAARPVAFSPARKYRVAGSRDIASTETDIDPQVVLFHEYTHHFMLRSFPAAYPSWYVEGFAEVNSTLKLRDDGSFLVGLPANHRSGELFQMSQLPIKRILDPANRINTAEEVLSKYSLGWLLVHYLTFGKKRDGQLLQYLKAVGAGENSLAAAERIFGDLGKLNSELQRYKTSGLAGLEVVPAGYTVPTVTMRKLDAKEEKTIRKRIVLSRGVTRSQAKSLIAELKPAAAASPADLTTQLLAAEAGLDAQDFAGASEAADRALAIKPDSVQALVFKARSMIEAPQGPPQRFATARALLAKARAIDPNDPTPLIETYNAWRKSGGPIPEEAAIALEDAFPMAAADDTYRLILTRQLLEEKRYPAARQVLAPLAFSFDGSDPDKNVPGLALASLDANNPADALARIDRELKKRESGEDDD